jgi:hypothetical protein
MDVQPKDVSVSLPLTDDAQGAITAGHEQWYNHMQSSLEIIKGSLVEAAIPVILVAGNPCLRAFMAYSMHAGG